MANRFLSIDQIRCIEADAINLHHLNLMELAGNSLVSWIKSHYTTKQKIIILVGHGNNGGDGMIAAINLKNIGYNVCIYAVAGNLNPTTEKFISKFSNLGGVKLSRLPTSFKSYALIVDAIIGIGISADLDANLTTIVETINKRSNSCVLSVDTPTGLDPFSGKVCGVAIRANYTMTFISDKAGFYTGNGIDYAGVVLVKELVKLGVYQLANAQTISVVPNVLSNISYQVLERKFKNTNKGSFGIVGIIGGNKGMHGALYLAGRAALLLGSGKVVLASLDNNFLSDQSMPELMLTHPKDMLKNLDNYSVIIVGPGLGQDEIAIKLLKSLFKYRGQTKFIFDADALNLVALYPNLFNGFKACTNKIITPHPGEAGRLLGITTNEITQNRFLRIEQLRIKCNAITLLKGAGSLILDGEYIYLNETGTAGLSNAGQGDILCGITAAFIAQGLDLSNALRLAVFLHGKASEVLAEKIGYNGVLASEVIVQARLLLNQILYNIQD